MLVCVCTLGRPYRNPGREPEVDKKLLMFSLIDDLIVRRILLSLSSKYIKWEEISAVTLLKFVCTLRILRCFCS